MNCIKNVHIKIMFKKWNYKKWTYKKRTYKEWTYKKKNWSAYNSSTSWDNAKIPTVLSLSDSKL